MTHEQLVDLLRETFPDAACQQIEDALLAWRENNPAPEDVTE